MNKTTFEKGEEAGLESGRTAIQNVVIGLGTKRFGPASADIEIQIRTIQDFGQLADLAERTLDADSWSDLFAAK